MGHSYQVRDSAALLLLAAFSLTIGGCSHRLDPTDACGLLKKSDVERVLGVKVNEPIVELPRPVGLHQGRVGETVSGCIYTVDGPGDHPARVALHVSAYRFRQRDPAYPYIVETPRHELGAQRVPSLGDEAWQGATLEIHKDNLDLLIEVDDLPPVPPPQSADRAPATRLYPELEVEFGRIVLGRL